MDPIEITKDFAGSEAEAEEWAKGLKDNPPVINHVVEFGDFSDTDFINMIHNLPNKTKFP